MAVLNCIYANASKSRFLIALLLLMGTLSLTACGGDGPGSSNTSLGSSQGGSSGGGSSSGGDDTTTTTGVKVGSGTGASFTEGVIGTDKTDLQAGGSTTLRINFVDLDNAAYGNVVSVSFTSDCYANGIANFSSTAIDTNSGGFGTTTYTANGCSGTDEIVATATVDGEVLTATVDLTIEADEVLGLSYEGATSTTLNLAGTGGTETTQLTFRLIGAQGASIVGENVSFSIQGDEGDATLAPGTETDVSDSNGTVTTVLQSGTVATNIRVTATHDNTLISATSDSIAISSGLPIQNSYSMTQSSYNPANTFATDGIEVSVNILAADQFGNRVAEGTSVSFYAECGVIQPSCVIDETSGCSVTWVSNTANQDDGAFRCSILSFTEGVETFTDNNGNFVYEDSDTFNVATSDLPEPFLDENENGSFDIGERFVDTANGTSGAYDGANGLWDGLCLAGSVPTANCMGDDSAVIFAQGLITITCDRVNVISASPAQDSTIDLTMGDPGFVTVTIQDGCTAGNPPAEGTTIEFTGDGIEVVDGASQVVPNNITTPVSFSASFRGDDTSEPGELKLVITPPDGISTTLFWTVID